jgi:hypothetical protein
MQEKSEGLKMSIKLGEAAFSKAELKKLGIEIDMRDVVRETEDCYIVNLGEEEDGE